MIAPRTRPVREDEMEHRWGVRIVCRANVVIRTADGACAVGRLRDVSSSGAFVETTEPIPLLANVSIAIVRDGAAGAQKEIRASVVRHTRDGVALEWCETPEGYICTGLGCESRCAAAIAPR